MTKTAFFKNPRWRTAATVKIVKSPYLSEKLSDFDEIRYTTWPKIEIFEIQDGGDRRLDNRFFGHNSCPISAKFCVRKQNGMPTKGHMTKTAHFKIQDGGRPPFGKSLNHHISVKMLLDFDKIWRIPEHILNLMRFSKALSQYLRSE